MTWIDFVLEGLPAPRIVMKAPVAHALLRAGSRLISTPFPRAFDPAPIGRGPARRSQARSHASWSWFSRVSSGDSYFLEGVGRGPRRVCFPLSSGETVRAI